MDKEKMNEKELTEKEMEQVSGGTPSEAICKLRMGQELYLCWERKLERMCYLS